MAAELFEGNIASEMTLGEAIARGILKAPKYITAVYAYEKQLAYYEDRIRRAQSRVVQDKAEKLLQALRRTLKKADGIDQIFHKHMEDATGKYLVFTPNYEVLRTCMEKVPEWFGLVDQAPRLYYLYSLEQASLDSFQRFKKDQTPDHLRLLFTIDALNEGIHVEDISGVILFRPTVSPIVYKQQIGRALTAGSSKEPVIFDIVNNFENLYSLGSIEEEMRAAITYYNYIGEGDEIITERFQLVDELMDCRKLFKQLEGVLSASWDLMYEKAAEYYREHHDLELPNAYKTTEGYPLGRWVDSQRRIRAGTDEGSLDEERIQKLDAIGMRWESDNDFSWRRHYAACEQYYKEHGNLEVPSSYVVSTAQAALFAVQGKI